MGLCEDLDCGVCFQSYSRSERVPRMLFCNHTFCSVCLESMAEERSNLLIVRCPLCRQVSCVRGGLGLDQALWVNSHLWDYLTEAEEQNQEKEESSIATAQAASPAQAVSPAQTGCGSRPNSKQHRPKLRLPNFLKGLKHLGQPQERIVPGCNVQMKSWRRIAGEETF